MSLSADLISEFVKATKDESTDKKETTMFGTIKELDGIKYVKLDGSEILTPVSTTVDAKENERVTVTIKNHSVIVTGNLTPEGVAARTGDVQDLGETVDDIDIRLQGKVAFEDLSISNPKTVIHGANIKTGTITADKLNVDDVFAEDILVTGSFQINNGDLTLTASEDGVDITSIAGPCIVQSGLSGVLIYGTLGVTLNSVSSNVDIIAGHGDVRIGYYDDRGNLIGPTPMTDFVVEEGTSGGWYYRKWYSGKAEVWRSDYKSLSCTASLGVSSFFRTDEQNYISYPFKFVQLPVVSMTFGGDGSSGLLWTTSSGSTDVSPKYYLIRPDKLSGSCIGYVNIYAYGRWK